MCSTALTSAVAVSGDKATDKTSMTSMSLIFFPPHPVAINKAAVHSPIG